MIERLKREIESLTQQAQEYANLHQQAIGALLLAKSLLESFESEAVPVNGTRPLTVEQFAEMVGGKGAIAEIVPLPQDNGNESLPKA